MRSTISTAAFLMLVLGCGGRTLLDDPNNELRVLVDAGRVGSGEHESDGGKDKDAGSSSGGSPGTVSCGTQTCDTASEDCCASLTGMANSASCVAKGKCMGVAMDCSGSSDCAEGEVCCGTLGGAGGAAGGFPGGLGATAGGFPGGLGGTAGGFGGTAGGLGATAGGLGTGGLGGAGFSITVQCAKSCGNGGFQLCSSNSDCAEGVTCQATMFGAKLCGGLGAFGGGTLAGGTLAGGTAAGGTAAGGTAAGGTFGGGTFAGGTFAGGTFAGGTAGFGGFPGGADGGFGGFAGGFPGFGGFAGGGGIPGH